MEPMQPEGTSEIPQEGQPVEIPAKDVAPVEVEHLPNSSSAVAVTEHAGITITATDAHPSALKRAVTIAHEIMRRVVLEGEHILDEIEAVLFTKDDGESTDSADPGAGE